MKRFLSLGLLAALTVTLLTGCANKGGLDDDYVGIDGDYVTGTPLPDRIEGANFYGSTVNRSQFPPVYFGYDSVTVADSEFTTLDTVASALEGNNDDVIIAGFTDVRGTEEYNRGLGERRAQAVRESLIGLGISGSRIQTVSFGEEMPADPGSGDSAWAANRRAEFGLIR
ncbi:MAG: OmpA family protein [Chthoniobacterales bacterium]